jgi:hypothetical protein
MNRSHGAFLCRRFWILNERRRLKNVIPVTANESSNCYCILVVIRNELRIDNDSIYIDIDKRKIECAKVDYLILNRRGIAA